MRSRSCKSYVMVVTALFAGVWSIGSARVAPTERAPAGIVLEAHGYGWRLTDAKGRVLYVSSRDTEPGKSKCVEKCQAMWPPAVAQPEEAVEGDWTKLTRADGQLQWAYRGKPLYRFSGDGRPGDTNGDGLDRGSWKVAIKPVQFPSGMTVVSTSLGYVLADANGMVLYTSDRDKGAKRLQCDLRCSHTWNPFVAPWTASSKGDWSVITAADGTKQWAYKKHPLYLHRLDVKPGEILGERAENNWHTVVLEPPPSVPGWVTVQASPSNLNVYGDANGMTLYMHIENTVESLASSGGFLGLREGTLRPQDWRPVLADANAQPVGDWSVITGKDGTKQWAYRGLALFTNVNDTRPGDMNGVRRSDLTFRPISVTGKLIAGTGA